MPRGVMRSTGRHALLVGLIVLGVPAVSVAWPAVQDVTGVHLCDSRPVQQPDGRWICRSGGVPYEGGLVDVSQGPGAPPGVMGSGGRPPFGPYGGSWGGPPNRGPSGYDALGPWLGGPTDR